jgi:phosphohistidine phosphatase
MSLSLCRAGNEKAFQALSSKYPTGGLAIIDFDLQGWHEVTDGSGKLRDFILPHTKSP